MFLQDMGVANVVGTMTIGQASAKSFSCCSCRSFSIARVKWVFASGSVRLGDSVWPVSSRLRRSRPLVALLGRGTARHLLRVLLRAGHIYVDQEAPEAIRFRRKGSSRPPLPSPFLWSDRSSPVGRSSSSASPLNAELLRHRAISTPPVGLKAASRNGRENGRPRCMENRSHPSGESDAAQWNAAVEIFDRTAGLSMPQAARRRRFC